MALIGDRLPRVEDERLITGRGRYASDGQPARLCHLALLRSPHPHARIERIDLEQARARPGVLAIWTAEDLAEHGLATMPRSSPAPALDDLRAQPVLAAHELCHIGQPMAALVAETPQAAADALDAILPELTPLPAVGGASRAAAPGAPTAHAGAASNVAGRARLAFGNIEGAFARAPVTISRTLSLARVLGAAMEPRAVTASPEPDGRLTVRTSTQTVFAVRDAVAQAVGLPADRVRVVAEDVGGGFGAKGSPYPEELLVALAAWRLGRPVRWVASRSEDGTTTNQAHGTVLELELSAEADGRLRGLRGRMLHDLGAFAGSGTGQFQNIGAHMLSTYRLPAYDVHVESLYTNVTPSGFIRGGGRDVGNFAIERLLDGLADDLGLDRGLVRERNLLHPDQMPYDTGFPMAGGTARYDLGDVPAMLAGVRDALRAAAPQRPPEPGSGRARGQGLACFAESTGFGTQEVARIAIDSQGLVRVAVGSTPQGQGHETMVAQIVAERLGWPMERIRVRAGDTSIVPMGTNTAGSRSAVHVGNVAAGVAREARRRLLELGAERLEAGIEDLVLHDGVLEVRGAPARRLEAGALVPAEGLQVSYTFAPERGATWASGCLGVLVEVDLETCRVDVVRAVLAHDSGRIINPTMADGQLHGGLAHGIGYALYEDAAYEGDGTMRAPSFLDYAIVSAPEMAARIDLRHEESPSPANPEGFRGIGESATIPVPAAVCAAIEDALRGAGLAVEVSELPVSPERLFQLVRGAAGRS